MSLWTFGNDMSKWLIRQIPDGRWTVCPPLSSAPNWWQRGGIFDTGAEALAAFAKGGAQ